MNIKYSHIYHKSSNLSCLSGQHYLTHTPSTTLKKNASRKCVVCNCQGQQKETCYVYFFIFIYFLFYLYIYPPDLQESNGDANI